MLIANALPVGGRVALASGRLGRGLELPLRRDDPAIAAMTDLRHVAPRTVSPRVPVDNALERMRLLSVRFLFVTADAAELLGAVSRHDLLGERLDRYLRASGGAAARGGVRVENVMRTRAELPVLDLDSVRQARIAELLDAFEAEDVTHLPVIERGDGGAIVVRGLFSASEIARRLGAADRFERSGRSVRPATMSRAGFSENE